MPVYILSAEAISPQDTFRVEKLSRSSFNNPERLSEKGYFCAQHPTYKEYINPAALRRMSPVIRMGLTTSKLCLEKAGIEKPDAILVGTGLGCVRDTAKFLGQLIENQEQLLNPTAFIQSTHNTVSGQIALMLACREYNLTFSQNSISFQTALLDGMLMLEQGEASTVLIGGIDEVVDESHHLMEKNVCLDGPAGEGSNFFVLSSGGSEKSMARIDGLEILSHCKAEEIRNRTQAFLASKGLALKDIDIFISGRNGDGTSQTIYEEIEQLFDPAMLVGYKHLVGEYDTATAFASWLAARIISDGVIPDALRIKKFTGEASNKDSVRRVLIFNHSKGRDLSWILLSHPDS